MASPPNPLPAREGGGEGSLSRVPRPHPSGYAQSGVYHMQSLQDISAGFVWILRRLKVSKRVSFGEFEGGLARGIGCPAAY